MNRTGYASLPFMHKVYLGVILGKTTQYIHLLWERRLAAIILHKPFGARRASYKKIAHFFGGSPNNAQRLCRYPARLSSQLPIRTHNTMGITAAHSGVCPDR